MTCATADTSGATSLMRFLVFCAKSLVSKMAALSSRVVILFRVSLVSKPLTLESRDGSWSIRFEAASLLRRSDAVDTKLLICFVVGSPSSCKLSQIDCARG